MANTPTNKPSSNEDEYFARENAEKMRKIALERSRELESTDREQLKAAHWMRCPKCGFELQEIAFRDIHIDRCFNCGVTVFDAGELEKIGVEEEESRGKVMKSILNIFR